MSGISASLSPPCACKFCGGRCPKTQNLELRSSYGHRCSECSKNCSKNKGSRLEGSPQMPMAALPRVLPQTAIAAPEVVHAGLVPPLSHALFAHGQPEPRLFVEQQAGCDVLSSSAAVVKQWMVDLGRRLHGRDPAAGGGPVVAAPEAALGDKVTSVVGESQEADEQADGPLEETGCIYGVATLSDRQKEGTLIAVAAATFSGSGRLQLLLHAAPTYKGAAVVGVLCARRLRERLGMRDLWAPNLDLAIGVPYSNLQLEGSSGALAVAIATVACATGAESRYGWVITGALSLSGHVHAVASVRYKAVAAYRTGNTGVILPIANLDDARSDEWPVDSVVSEDVRRMWPMARRNLLFKGVETLEETIAFVFPSLASSLQGPARRARGRPAGVKRARVAVGEVGPATFVTTPVPGIDGKQRVLARAEACFVRGPRGLPSVSGGYDSTAATDAHLAWLLVTARLEALEALVRSEVRGGRLAWDPREGGEEGSAHLNLMDAPINTAGFMMLPMFLALAALITGLEVRPQLSVFGFCAVTGDMQPVGPNMRGMVNAAHALGVQTLVLAEGDAELLGPVAQGTGLTVLGVAGVDELLTAQVFQQRPHT